MANPRVSFQSFHRRCALSTSMAAFLVVLASPSAMSQGTTAAGGGAGGGSAGPAGTAAAQPGAPSTSNGLPPLSANGVPPTSSNGLPPMSGNGLPPSSGNGLPPLSGNGLPPTGTAGVGGASNGVTNGTNAPPMAGGTPTRMTSSTEAFGMLDRSRQGFVTRADTNRVPGFMGFDYADVNRDGQLSPEEFANAWSFYSGQPK